MSPDTSDSNCRGLRSLFGDWHALRPKVGGPGNVVSMAAPPALAGFRPRRPKAPLPPRAGAGCWQRLDRETRTLLGRG